MSTDKNEDVGDPKERVDDAEGDDEGDADDLLVAVLFNSFLKLAISDTSSLFCSNESNENCLITVISAL